MVNGNPDIWVLIETEEDGRPKEVGLELLTPARELARQQGGTATAIVIGQETDAAVEAAGIYGAGRILVVQGREYGHYSTDAYAAALVALARRDTPFCILIGATDNGRDLAPRVACRLHTGLTADCTSLALDLESGCVAWTRPAFSGSLMATILCPQRRPQMGTVRPGVFPKPQLGPNRADIVREDIPILPGQIRTQLLEFLCEAGEQTSPVDGAGIIVAGGRGVGGARGFALLRELAQVLGAAMGGSRAAVEAGWIPHSSQIGQTGKCVRPRLYLACGISGAVQHVAGMGHAEYIVAINKNPDAPIFKVAHCGVVGDLFEIVPALTRQIRTWKQQTQPLEKV